jgi:hypothetical protein
MNDTELKALTSQVKKLTARVGFGAAFAENYSAEAGFRVAVGKSAQEHEAL